MTLLTNIRECLRPSVLQLHRPTLKDNLVLAAVWLLYRLINLTRGASAGGEEPDDLFDHYLGAAVHEFWDSPRFLSVTNFAFSDGTVITVMALKVRPVSAPITSPPHV